MTSPVQPSYTSIASVLGATGTGSTGSTGTGSSGSSTGVDAFGTDTFLKLLVAQMRYQDPSSPQDGSQFLAQTAQFSMVEKLNQLADQNAQLLATDRGLSAAGLIGRTITWSGTDGDVSGVVTSASLGTDGPVLRVGDQEVPMASVKEVATTPAA